MNTDSTGGPQDARFPVAPADQGVLPVGPAIPPLNITGLVVAKADLVNALRIYVPQLADITVLDNECFLLSLTPPPQGEDK